MNKQYVITSFSSEIDTSTEIICSNIPQPDDNQILIKNEYVGINALYDRELYRGAVPYIDVIFPFVFGVEAVGIVESVGRSIKNFSVGDAVGTVKVGTAYQEYQVVNESEAISFPSSTPEYLAISPTGVSADLALNLVSETKPGNTVVVSAAAGGLGHILVQLCKQKDCHVVGICGSDAKQKMLKTLNSCDRIINYRKESIYDVLSTEYSGRIDVGFDSVGRNIFDAMIANVAPLGRIVVMGLASELSDTQFEKKMMARVYESIYWKGASVRCFMNHLYRDKHAESRNKLFKMYKVGELSVKIDPTSFEGIESINKASKYLLEGRSCGKVVVKI